VGKTIFIKYHLIMALVDAKLFKQDVYTLIVDLTSAFNTAYYDKLLWILYDLKSPTDAIDVINLYTEARTEICLPLGGNTESIPVERGAIQ
jgi:hypothetical protein